MLGENNMIGVYDRTLAKDIRDLAERARKQGEKEAYTVLVSLASGTLPDASAVSETQIEDWINWLDQFQNYRSEALIEFLESFNELRNKTRFS